MILVLDNIVFSLQRTGGISMVWGELIKQLEMNKALKVCYLEYADSKTNIVRGTLKLPEERLLYPNHLNISIERYLPLRLQNYRESHIFHSSYYRYSTNSQSVNITTVHDFTYEYFVKGMRGSIHKWQKNAALRHSDYIICISENTRKDMLKFLPDIDAEKVRVIYNGVSDDYHPVADGESDLPFEPFSYVLFVGAREPYKNFEFAVQAIKGINLKLVIVGAPLNEKELHYLNSNLKSNQYRYVGRISNESLNILYNYAYTLMYPSSYEGFGIPVLEAQKAGCPVIAYNASSIPEIIGKTPLLLNRIDVHDVHEKFNLLSHEKNRNDIIANGLINAERFSWNKMARQYVDLYKEGLNK